MWELPLCVAQSAEPDAGNKLEPSAPQLCVVRHSITDTDYEVRVVGLRLKALGKPENKLGRWIDSSEIVELPLTGLTRKILRKLGGQ
jgi:A/G-specific adenine glycosylase